MSNNSVRRRWRDVRWAAEVLGCSTITIRRMVYGGELTGLQAGQRLLRVDEAEVLAHLDASIITPNPSRARSGG